jgi:predicted dehydrogenase
MAIRVGLIGAGSIAQSHIRDYYQTRPPEAELLACADPDAAARDRFSTRYGLPAYADPAELLSRMDVDAVDICTPPVSHPTLIAAAAEAHKHALCEKPLATDYAEAAAAVAAAEQAGVRVGVNHNYRWRAEYAHARDVLASGRLGTPFMASLQALLHWHGGVPYRRAAKRMLMIEQTIHYVDLLRFLLDSNVTRVYAVAGKPANQTTVGETFASLILNFTNGAIGSIVNSGEAQGARANWGGETIVQAEDGTIYLNRRQLYTFEMYSPGSGGHSEITFSSDLYSPSTNQTFDRPLHGFFKALETGQDLPVSAADNLNTLAAVLAAYESAETAQAVDVPAFAQRQVANAKQPVLR